MPDETAAKGPDRPLLELPRTGERMVPGVTGKILYEHLHRYAVACELVHGRRVLDLACGEGYGSNLLASHATQVTGVDNSAQAINHARRSYTRPNLTFVEGDCGEIPLANNSVDCVVSFETIQHIAHHERFLSEIKRVLEPSGWLLISSPDRIVYGMHRREANSFHKRELTHQDFVAVLKSQFRNCIFARQDAVSGSAILPASPGHQLRQNYLIGAFSGDMSQTRFAQDYTRGCYSLGLCSDAELPLFPIGLFDNLGQTNQHWNIVQTHSNLVADYEARVDQKDNEIAKLQKKSNSFEIRLGLEKDLMIHLRRDLSELRDSYLQLQGENDEMKAEHALLQQEMTSELALLREAHERLQKQYRSLQAEFEERAEWASNLQREAEELSFQVRSARRDYEGELDRRRALARSLPHLLFGPWRSIVRFTAPFWWPLIRTLFQRAEVRVAADLERVFGTAGSAVRFSGTYKKPGFAEPPLLEIRIGSAIWPLQVHSKADSMTGEFAFSGECRLGRGYKLLKLVETFRGSERNRLLAVRWRRAGNGHAANTTPPPATVSPDEGARRVGQMDLQTIRFGRVELPLVSIIIPIYNQLDYTLACLRSISEHAPVQEIEVIIGNDHSDEKVVATLKTIENLQIVDNSGPNGFLPNCNHAAKTARGQFLFFLNNDTVVKDNWLEPLLRVFRERPEAGIVGSKLIYPDGSLQEAGGIIWSDGSGWNYGRNDDPKKPEYNYLRETDYVSGAALMIERSLFQKVGCFSNRFSPAYYEDTDLAFKVRETGKRVFYQPESCVVHHEGKSCGTDTAGTGLKRYQVINAEKFFTRWQESLERDHFPNAQNVFNARGRTWNLLTIIVIDHYVPHVDQDAGSRSTFQYLRLFLEMGMNVKFIGDNFFPHQPYTQNLQRLGIEVLYGDWYRDNINQWLEENADQIGCIFANRSHITVKYLDTFKKMPNTRLLYYGHDLGSLRNRRKYELTGDPADLEASRKEKIVEQTIWEAVDAIYYPSPVETKTVAARLPRAPAFTLPLNIYVPQKLDYNENVDHRRDIMFVGGFNHPPNEDAVVWFLENCWSEVERKIPDCRFYCVGSKPTANLRQRADSRVEVTGWISDEDLSALYKRIRLVVIPLRYGAGIKGKVVEGLYHHVPMVISPIAAEGLPGIENYCRIAAGASEFTLHIVDLYRNPKNLSDLGNRGAEYLEKYFSKEAAIGAIRAGLGATAKPFEFPVEGQNSTSR